jgi:hypothetical protein
MTQPANQQYAPSISLIKAEARQVESNWGQYCRQKGVTLSSSSWATTPAGSACVTLTSQATSGNTATVIVTASSEDSCYVDNKATMSNGEILIRRFPVYVGA